MPTDPGSEIRFDGAIESLRGRVHRPASGTTRAAIVVAHGRHEDMDGPLIVALANRAAELGLWALRFNFAFKEAKSEPSAGHADEIADLREAITFARRSSGREIAFVAGRGLGAWASVAAAIDELSAGAMLLGLSYQGLPERRMALERLGEFEIPTLVVVGSRSDRVDHPALKDLCASMPSVNVEVVGGADHRLKDSDGRSMTETVLLVCEAWLRVRLR